MTYGPLNDRPKPLLACICSDFHQASNGGFNLIRVYDSVTVNRPSNLQPDAAIPVLVQSITCWTEGIGQHSHQLRLLDEDGQVVVETPGVTFNLSDFNSRHWVQDQIIIPVIRSTRFTVAVFLDGEPEPALRHVFTATVAKAGGMDS